MILYLLAGTALLLASAQVQGQGQGQAQPARAATSLSTAQQVPPPPSMPAWLRGATCYEVFVRSFYDSNGDGVGDLRGLIAKLDYINDGNVATTRDLGVRCLWLMPIAESPSYHGYDVSDYYRVKYEYGTNADFKRLITEAHRRGIRVLVDMVINHASSASPMFRAALHDTASPSRALFRWSPTPGPNNRWGGNGWHKSPVRDEYYYGFFWKGMPDLNYEQPQALAEMKKVATFWLTDMGADGFRLDAVKFLGEQGAQVDDTPLTHQVLRQYAAHVRGVKRDAYTVGEVFDGNRALASYYPDQLDGYFAFEVADSILASVRRGDARGLLAPVLELQSRLPAWRWSPFLRNHDQPRTMTELAGDAKKARLAATILLTLPGIPFVYYGEELGMSGNKPDEQLRTPMAWSASAPHAGFSAGTPWERLQTDSLVANVAAQESDSGSLLVLYRKLIHLRAEHPALASGSVAPVTTTLPSVVAYLRREGSRTVLVVINLGSTSVASVGLTAPRDALTPGRYAVRDLLGRVPSGTVHVSPLGQLQDNPRLPAMPPLSAYLFDLVATSRASRTP